MKFQLLTIFPEFFDSPLSTSILGRAQHKELVEYELVDIRDFATDRHRKTDDLPYGGGAGMLMKPEPLVGALEHARAQDPGATRILMSPQGEPLTQALAQELAEQPEGVILTCGRYEGVDERVREGWIDREISLGDYVLSGGEPGALVLLDAITRLVPGVLGNVESVREESFSGEGLEYPQYTRPRVFRDKKVPEILLSGDHAKIAQWRREKAKERTRRRRPDLLEPPNPHCS